MTFGNQATHLSSGCWKYITKYMEAATTRTANIQGKMINTGSVIFYDLLAPFHVW